MSVLKSQSTGDDALRGGRLDVVLILHLTQSSEVILLKTDINLQIGYGGIKIVQESAYSVEITLWQSYKYNSENDSKNERPNISPKHNLILKNP